MRKINKYIVFFTIMTFFITASLREVYAGLYDNVSSQYVEADYSVVTDFHEASSGQGEFLYKVSTNLSDIDELYIPYCMAVIKCCDNPSFPKVNHATVRVNGNTVYYDDSIEPIQSFLYMKYGQGEGRRVNLRSYRSANAQIEYEIYCRNQYCQNCGQRPEVQFKNGGLKFIDVRATASNVPPELNFQALGSGTISYTFSSNTSRIVWAVKYKGESGFTPLTEGTNRDGLIAASVNSKVLKLSNVPQSMDGAIVGTFLYDEKGQLPGGTSYPDTPFFTKINVSDNTAPTVEIKKTVDTATKSVILEVMASDSSGLHDTPYSYDGGVTYEVSNKKNITEPGIVKVAVRDVNGNVTIKDVSIDAVEIERANPKTPQNDEKIKEKEPESSKGGYSGNGGNTDNTAGGTGNGSKNTNPAKETSTPTGSLDKTKDKEKEYVSIDTTIKDNIVKVEETSNVLSSGDKGSKNKSTSDSKSLQASKISDKDSSDTFDRIRKNSENYIISMKETKKEEVKGAEKEKTEIDLKNIEEDDEAKDYSNSNTDDIALSTPDEKEDSLTVLVAIIAGTVILMLLLSLILFFGAIVFIKKDTEYTLLSGEEGMKVPVALLFISFKNGERSLCFGELLNKYDVLYVRFGALFSYMYENEKISILTRFKGEKKREIAKEIISKEIIVGKKGGKRK